LTHEEPTLSTRPHRSAAGAALAQCHHQQINRNRNPDLSFTELLLVPKKGLIRECCLIHE
jgi:hypothetical protein